MSIIRFFGPDNDAYVDGIAAHAREFEELSGHELKLEIIPETRYVTNDLREVSATLRRDNPPDIYMSGPVSMWALLEKNLVEPLDSYFDSASAAYDPDDFLSPLLECNRWDGLRGSALGDGPLLEIPINYETYNCAYLPRILEKNGVSDPPTTWDDYFDIAKKVSGSEPGVRGFAQRGTSLWHTIYTGFATQLWSCGGSDFAADGRSAIASPKAIQITRQFLTAVRDAGPVSWSEQYWLKIARDFAAGSYGLIVDSDHYVAIFEAESSNMRGQVAYAGAPAGPTGQSTPNLWTWSLVMNSRSTHKSAAWEFIEWASSPTFLRRSAFEGNMNPTRKSVWMDDRFRSFADAWGGFYESTLDTLENRAKILITPTTKYIDIAAIWSSALLRSFSDLDSLEETLTHAATTIDEILDGSR